MQTLLSWDAGPGHVVINMTACAHTHTYARVCVCISKHFHNQTSFSLFWSRCTTQSAQRQEERKKGREREGRLFFLRVPPCQSCKKATKPIILSSSFFSGAAEASLDCHMYKGSPYKAIHSTEWTRHLWGFLISSSLFFASFFKPCNQIWAKSNGGRIEGEQWGGGGGRRVQWKYLLLVWNEQVIYKMPSLCAGG